MRSRVLEYIILYTTKSITTSRVRTLYLPCATLKVNRGILFDVFAYRPFFILSLSLSLSLPPLSLFLSLSVSLYLSTFLSHTRFLVDSRPRCTYFFGSSTAMKKKRKNMYNHNGMLLTLHYVHYLRINLRKYD